MFPLGCHDAYIANAMADGITLNLSNCMSSPSPPPSPPLQCKKHEIPILGEVSENVLDTHMVLHISFIPYLLLLWSLPSDF